MMQELLLFGQVPAKNQQTLRQQLAGLARMQPQPVLERHLIFKPIPPAGLSNVPSGSGAQGAQQQELQKTKQMLNSPLSYVQLVGVVENGGRYSQVEDQAKVFSKMEDHDTEMTDSKDEPRQAQGVLKWYLEFKDIPEPGKVSATSRAISKTRILKGDPIQFLKDLGYEYLSQYINKGDKFYDQDTTLFIHRILQIPPDQTPQKTTTSPTFPAINTIPDISKLTPLDPSGSYILQASIEIADGNSTDLKDRATQQLLAMKETLRSSVELVPGDRLALDTRVPVRRTR